MNKAVIFIGLAAALAGCGQTEAGPPPKHCAENECRDARALVWIEKGKKAITARLKDPESAQFRKVFFHVGQDAKPFTCGEVNARNGFGGMVGFKRFLSAGKPELSFVDGDGQDFNEAWWKFCQS